MPVTLNTATRVLQHQPLNASQTFVGQLLDEFQIDRGLLSELISIRTAPLSEQIGSLSQVIRQNPDSTAPAICLLLALRQAGMLDQNTPELSGSNTMPVIPKRIVQFWHSPELPPDLFALMQSWRTSHPDHKYILFDDKKAQNFIAEHFPAAILRAYYRARHPAQRADLFRLAYLCIRGGFYVDADDRSLAPVSTIVPEWAHFVAYQEDYATIANNFLGVTPAHPVIRRALELAVLALNRGDNDTLWLSTGPGLLSRAFAQVFAETHDRAAFLHENIVLESWRYHRAVSEHCRLQYKRSNLHWSREAFGRRDPKQPRG
jgi:mannosyltransferase OCH1-like enzyme